MADKQIGLGTLVKVDEDANGSGHTTVTLVMSTTPPGRSRENVDITAIDDTLMTYAPGQEQHSQFVFRQMWDPLDTVHEHMDTLFGSKAIVEWQVVYCGSGVATDEFEGYVSNLEPQEITANGRIERTVTIQRRGAITRT